MDIMSSIRILETPHRIVQNPNNPRTIAIYNATLVSPFMLDNALNCLIKFVKSQIPDMEEHTDERDIDC